MAKKFKSFIERDKPKKRPRRHKKNLNKSQKKNKKKYKGQDHGTFTMKKVTRLSPYLGKEAPEGVIVLFDGSNLDAWTQESNIPGYLDLSKHVGGSECAEYLRTDVWSDINQDAILELGSNDGVAGWLNGEMIISENVLRRATPGQGMIPVSLKSGWNTFLMKIVNAGGGS